MRLDSCKLTILKELLRKIGINPDNCFFDKADNLIIPVSELPKELCLSDKVHIGNREIALPSYIDEKDVKEFIEKLREVIHREDWNGYNSEEIKYSFDQKINNLAGTKLGYYF
jgi:hypothetical protein